MIARTAFIVACALVAALVPAPARAHTTPPLVLSTERETVARLLGGATRYFVREVRLSGADREAIRQKSGWSPDDDYYRFYVGRAADGSAVGATVFLSEFTIHGPVRVAVAVGPDGKVKSASVVELTEESYTWVKPLLDSGFLQRFAGQDARSAMAQSVDVGGSMPRFYAELIARLIGRAAALYDVAMARK
jgi:hypothetical protein